MKLLRLLLGLVLLQPLVLLAVRRRKISIRTRTRASWTNMCKMHRRPEQPQQR
jgi:hypothetical protein